MYEQYFGLKHEPFSIAPDPRFLFMSVRHREALAHLLYGVDRGGGFVLLTGEIGAGKTTVCRCFLKQIPARCNVAYILNPKCTVDELLKTVCDEFGIPMPQQGTAPVTAQDRIDSLNQFLLQTHSVGQSNLLIIDEAQNLSADVLEQLRLLTNLETDERKLLQILLIGQPELRDMLARPDLEQLAQRVIAQYHLGALSETETEQYIRHRFAVAGRPRSIPFTREARQQIYKLTRGVPRRINLLCDRALLAAYGDGKAKVDRGLIDSAASEVFRKRKSVPWPIRRRVVWGAALFASTTLLCAAALTIGGSPRRQAAAVSGSPNPAASPSGLPATGAAALAARAVGPMDGMAAASAPMPSATASSPAQAPANDSAPTLLAAADLTAVFKSPLRDEREAWRELAPWWKLSVGNDDPCQAAQRQGVHCFTSRTDLALIRQLDRPGIVTLYDVDNKPVYALLTGLTGERATLRMAGVSQRVSLASLAKMWQGDFATFWQAPAGYSKTIATGSSGPVVDDLASKLAQLDGGRRPPSGQAMDASLRSRIYTFQLAHGLKPDGMAGPHTFMQINRATGLDEPHLQSDR